MPVICVRNNKNKRWKRNTEKKTKAEKNKGDKNYREKVRAIWFCCALKLGFLQSLCKASLIFKSNLSII